MTPPSITEQFVVLSPEKQATVEPNDATLYQRLDTGYDSFRGHELIACHRFDGDWPSWEAHPNGDEIVVLMAGSATFVLQRDGEETQVDLVNQGDYVIVPHGVWHTARVPVSAMLLFITPGEGTQHRRV